jgi:type II secretory pathway component PulK
MDRLAIAYSLIALLVVSVVGGAAYWRYHSHQRTYERGQARERKAHDARMAERDGKGA